MWLSGSYEPPGQFVTPVVRIVPYGPSGLLTTIGVKIGPIRYFETSFSACARSSGEIDQIIDRRNSCNTVGRRLRRHRLRRRIPFSGHVAFRNRYFLDRPDRL